MNNFKILTPLVVGATVLLVGARSISWETNHPAVGACTGACYEAYKEEDAKRREAERAMMASASPAEIGQKLYPACAACHGMQGEGGVGPMLAGQTQDAIVSMLTQYKNGETRGAQSALMWGQSAGLSSDDMTHLGAYIATF
jgi:cytochrome c553